MQDMLCFFEIVLAVMIIKHDEDQIESAQQTCLYSCIAD